MKPDKAGPSTELIATHDPRAPATGALVANPDTNLFRTRELSTELGRRLYALHIVTAANACSGKFLQDRSYPSGLL
jgi:hypothetical protein